MLSVQVDGVPISEELARAMWERFSAWMEEHRGDLAGFAKQEGFMSVHPGVGDDGPVLLASHREAQRPYEDARAARSGSSPGRGSAGSKTRHSAPSRQPMSQKNRKK